MAPESFVKARIGDDEERAERMRHFEVEDIYYSCPAVRDPEWAGDLETGEENCDCGMLPRRARLLRECEAYRAILALGTVMHPRAVDDYFAAGYEQACEHVARVLARIWRAHPDYDPRWEQR